MKERIQFKIEVKFDPSKNRNQNGIICVHLMLRWRDIGEDKHNNRKTSKRVNKKDDRISLIVRTINLKILFLQIITVVVIIR